MPARKKAVRKKAASRKKSAPPDGPFEPATAQAMDKIVAELHSLYPDANCELDWDTPLQLLVATILSAQSTDVRVNEVGKTLFKKYKTAKAFAEAKPEVFEQDIRSTGFFRQKAKNVMASGRLLALEHGGEVPQDLDALIKLPGVARKTANVVLGTAFGIPSGFVVDTHVKRLAYRLGLTKETNPVKVESDLMAKIPQDEWIFAAHALIWHGRRVCDAKKPNCRDCSLASLCPRNGLPLED